ncbi:MAG TPA: hypothetical protein ENI23_04965 [bacterium]|nr:hypothetical protein [bacterium]
MDETQSFKTLKEMMNPQFDWDKLDDYEILLGLAEEAVYLQEVPQRILGKIALTLTTKYGDETLTRFAKELGKSKSSLTTYRWVESRLKGLDIPIDLKWSSLRVIAGADNPAAWITKVQEEGLSTQEVKRLVKIEKGEPITHSHKKIKCPSCDFVTEGVKCGGCGEVL